MRRSSEFRFTLFVGVRAQFSFSSLPGIHVLATFYVFVYPSNGCWYSDVIV